MKHAMSTLSIVDGSIGKNLDIFNKIVALFKKAVLNKALPDGFYLLQ